MYKKVSTMNGKIFSYSQFIALTDRYSSLHRITPGWYKNVWQNWARNCWFNGSGHNRIKTFCIQLSQSPCPPLWKLCLVAIIMHNYYGITCVHVYASRDSTTTNMMWTAPTGNLLIASMRFTNSCRLRNVIERLLLIK